MVAFSTMAFFSTVDVMVAFYWMAAFCSTVCLLFEDGLPFDGGLLLIEGKGLSTFDVRDFHVA